MTFYTICLLNIVLLVTCNLKNIILFNCIFHILFSIANNNYKYLNIYSYMLFSVVNFYFFDLFMCYFILFHNIISFILIINSTPLKNTIIFINNSVCNSNYVNNIHNNYISNLNIQNYFIFIKTKLIFTYINSKLLIIEQFINKNVNYYIFDKCVNTFFKNISDKFNINNDTYNNDNKNDYINNDRRIDNDTPIDNDQLDSLFFTDNINEQNEILTNSLKIFENKNNLQNININSIINDENIQKINLLLNDFSGLLNVLKKND
jgi:hypothetical protein